MGWGEEFTQRRCLGCYGEWKLVHTFVLRGISSVQSWGARLNRHHISSHAASVRHGFLCCCAPLLHSALHPWVTRCSKYPSGTQQSPPRSVARVASWAAMASFCWLLPLICHLGIMWPQASSTLTDILLSPQDSDARTQIESAPDGSTIFLLPGTYTHLCNVSIYNNLELRSRGGWPELDCGNVARHLQIFGPVSVHLEGIVFSNGRAGHGGCMAVFGATVTIQHSLFRDCHADLDGGSGGVIHAEESTIRMSNSAVVVASAGEGGALYLSGSSFVADANVTFTECSAQQWGGLAYMWQSHLQFSNNVSVTSCVALSGGGLAYLEQATMVAQQGVFIHDIMSASSGGMVFMVQSHMELSNGVEVHTLQAFEFGGMAYLVAGSTAIVRHNVSLLECYGWNSAGVVYVDVGCSFTAEDNVVISGCIGEANGGLAYVWQGHLELRRGIVIEQCSSQIGGGVLYLEEATANISSNVSITNCWSAWGGVFSVVYSHLKLSDGVEVVGASAADWGGVFQAVEGIVEARHSMRFIDPYASSG
eukprot:2009596-Rhodomonas_salina.1